MHSSYLGLAIDKIEPHAWEIHISVTRTSAFKQVCLVPPESVGRDRFIHLL